jgi:hypothetical protein
MGSRANRDKLAPAITVVSLRASWAVTSEDRQCKCVLCLLSLVPRCLSIASSIIYMVHSSSLVRHPTYSPSSLAILLFNRFTVCTLCLGLVVSRVHRRRCSWVERSSPTCRRPSFTSHPAVNHVSQLCRCEVFSSVRLSRSSTKCRRRRSCTSHAIVHPVGVLRCFRWLEGRLQPVSSSVVVSLRRFRRQPRDVPPRVQ